LASDDAEPQLRLAARRVSKGIEYVDIPISVDERLPIWQSSVRLDSLVQSVRIKANADKEAIKSSRDDIGSLNLRRAKKFEQRVTWRTVAA
jgi:hypothetical protein